MSVSLRPRSRFLLTALVGLAGGLTPPAVAADEAAEAPAEVVPTSPADVAWAEVTALQSSSPTVTPWAEMTPAQRRESLRMNDVRTQALEAAVTAFAAQFPDDPRRLEVFVQLSYQPPKYITGFSSADDEMPGWNSIIGDEAKMAAFEARQAKRIAEVLASPDATKRQVGGAFYTLFVEARGRFMKDQTSARLQEYLDVAEAMMDRLPDAAANLAKEHLGFLKFHGTAEQQAAFVARLESSDDPDVKQMVAESRGDFSRFSGIADIAFTAADGREIDLGKMRGKVVLIDFWATWCGPCIGEIPNVVANYQKYHDRGFEVIGVTLENSGVRKDFDDPANASKLKMAKAKMLAFAKSKDMPWPQYYDGKFWQNDLALRFGIKAIPAMVLIGPDGQVASIEARGEELERQILRLLPDNS
ncbi:TlpA family protein disulfide reductase [Synoicihabitans lomoniglobus]|uniref:TlpA disulfide reductase family protein n=1 Tax=Synoicihabitans lomoniglobus TaxID=2909285 RepID=A0AAE9ZWD6_9BACT|nr:TlpA family protein disulfide reductase [Opitutaceae bacterium LMO-M01]WED64319.1 TlpA disulfide reductase family protein [Opitutaceae bacterium LMO-M01]